jgi:hypothetical protein
MHEESIKVRAIVCHGYLYGMLWATRQGPRPYKSMLSVREVGTAVWNKLATIALDGWPDRFNRCLPLA